MNVSTSTVPVSAASIPVRGIGRTFVFALLLVGLVSAPAFATPEHDPCSWLQSFEPGQAHVTGAPSPDALFAIEVTEPGWLALQAESAKVGETNAAWLELVGSPCETSGIAPVGNFLDHGMVEIRQPGTVYLKMGSVGLDASGTAPDLRLSTHLFPTSDRTPWDKEGEDGSDTEESDDEILPFLFPGNGCFTQAQTPSGASRDPWTKEGEDGSDTEESDDEILPFLFPGSGCITQSLADTAGSRDPWTKEGEDGSDTEESDDEILPFLFPGSGCVTQAYAPVGESRGDWDKEGEDGSDTEESDDEILPFLYPGGRASFECTNTEPMNDLRICAAHVGMDRRIEGRFDSRAGLDRDYYAFTLAQLGRIRLTGTGSVDLVGSLYDAHGRQLLSHGQQADGFTLAATLAAGRYYLRVEGYEGEYRIDFGQ